MGSYHGGENAEPDWLITGQALCLISLILILPVIRNAGNNG